MKKILSIFVGVVLFFLLISCNLTNLFQKQEQCNITCDASSNTSSGKAPLNVMFVGNATVTGCKEIPTYFWDFGDGSSATTQNAVHLYKNAGTYIWKFTVTAGGVTCSRSGTINVTPSYTGSYSQKDYEPPTPQSPSKGMAGVGIKLVTNLRSGVFRVKINGEVVTEHSFSNQKVGKNVFKPKKLLKASEYEWAKEFKVPPGDCKIKLVIEDNQGSRGEKVINLNLQPNQHKFLRVIVKGAPGDIRVEM